MRSGRGGREHPSAAHRTRRSPPPRTGVARVQVRWSGSFAWGKDALSDIDALGPDEQLVDSRQAGRLEPNLRVPPTRAVVKSTDGAVDPVAVTEALVRGARSHGAEVRLGEPVTRLRVKDGSVVGLDMSTEFLASRTVVVAAGSTCRCCVHRSEWTCRSLPHRPCCFASAGRRDWFAHW
jgi:glycine/D-amino acid oxidase-like deaminating enzyme